MQYPRTPYPLEVIRESPLEGTGSVVEWLQLQQDDEYYPEYLALSPTEQGPAQAPLGTSRAIISSDWAYEPVNTSDHALEPQFEVVDYSDISSSSGETSSDSEDSSLVDVDLLERAIAAETAAISIEPRSEHLTVPVAEVSHQSPPPQRRRQRSASIPSPCEQPILKRPRLEPCKHGQPCCATSLANEMQY